MDWFSSDSDSDADCATGLVCYQRSPGDPVPGCNLGSPVADMDYCVTSTDVATASFLPSSSPSQPPMLGDNATSSLAPSDISSFPHLPVSDSIALLESDGTPSVGNQTSIPIPSDATSSVPLSTSDSIALVGDNGTPQTAFPLQRCQGDWYVFPRKIDI
jgi:hypothetical protein